MLDRHLSLLQKPSYGDLTWQKYTPLHVRFSGNWGKEAWDVGIDWMDFDPLLMVHDTLTTYL